MSDKVKERIEKEAIALATEILGQPPFMMDDTIVTGYIAGATAERPKAWNEAIDECILVAFKDDGSHWIDLRNKLESLKHKQP